MIGELGLDDLSVLRLGVHKVRHDRGKLHLALLVQFLCRQNLGFDFLQGCREYLNFI